MALGGQYVLQVEFSSQWQGEHGNSLVELVNTPKEIEGILLDYEITSLFHGAYADYPNLREKEQRRIDALQRAFNAAVSELLNNLPEHIE